MADYTPGETLSHYDSNGNLTGVVFTGDGSRNRDFVSNLTGQIVAKTHDGKSQRYLFADGGERASYGTLDTVDVDQNYTPISDSTLGTSPGRYVVNAGDTLKGIALATWGDASLWYLIAEANGLSSDDQLRAASATSFQTRISR